MFSKAVNYYHDLVIAFHQCRDKAREERAIFRAHLIRGTFISPPPECGYDSDGYKCYLRCAIQAIKNAKKNRAAL